MTVEHTTSESERNAPTTYLGMAGENQNHPSRTRVCGQPTFLYPLPLGPISAGLTREVVVRRRSGRLTVEADETWVQLLVSPPWGALRGAPFPPAPHFFNCNVQIQRHVTQTNWRKRGAGLTTHTRLSTHTQEPGSDEDPEVRVSPPTPPLEGGASGFSGGSLERSGCIGR